MSKAPQRSYQLQKRAQDGARVSCLDYQASLNAAFDSQENGILGLSLPEWTGHNQSKLLVYHQNGLSKRLKLQELGKSGSATLCATSEMSPALPCHNAKMLCQ